MRKLSLLMFVIALLSGLAWDLQAQNFAVEFLGDGQTRVVAPDSDSLDITDEITMGAWVYPTALTAQAIIVNKEDSWEIELQDGILKCAIRAAEWAWKGGGNVPLEEWTHVAATFDGKAHHTFVNGEYQVSSPNPGKIQTTDHGFHVGWRPLFDEPFTGIIDEVRISNVVRYLENIDFDVPEHAFTPDEHTVVLYHFDEGKGDEAKDASENRNDAKLEGGAKFVKSDAPIKPASIKPSGKLATTWANIKSKY